MENLTNIKEVIRIFKEKCNHELQPQILFPDRFWKNKEEPSFGMVEHDNYSEDWVNGRYCGSAGSKNAIDPLTIDLVGYFSLHRLPNKDITESQRKDITRYIKEFEFDKTKPTASFRAWRF